MSSKLKLREKYSILHYIPYCINVVPVDTAVIFLKKEANILREEEYNKKVYLSDQYYEFLTAHLLTRRSEEDFNKLIQYYENEKSPLAQFWMGFALADYKYEGAVDGLIEAYNTIGIGEYRYYALLGLTNFETPEVREVMERALTDEYVPPHKKKSKDEKRYVIRELAREYLDR